MSIAGMEPSGRQTVGPAATLVELDATDGSKFTAMVFEEMFHGHHGLRDDVELVLPFMEFPMVRGVVELTHYLPDAATFVYRSGELWTIAELIRFYRDRRQTCGEKAALELCATAGRILQEASENGWDQGIVSHGNINPYRIALTADGELRLIGYGVPQVEVLKLREDDKFPIKADSLRYCPPERLIGAPPEDVRSDLYGVALVAFEMIIGTPLHDGTEAQLNDQVRKGEAGIRLHEHRRNLRKGLFDFFETALKYDPDTRHESGVEFAEAADALLKKADGASLVDLMAQVATRRRGTALGRSSSGVSGPAPGARPGPAASEPGRASLSASGAARPGLAARRGRAADDEEEKPRESRWGKVSRSADEEESERPRGRGRARGGDADDSTKRSSARGRGRSAEKEEAPTRERESASSSADEESSGESRFRSLRGSSRRGASDDEESGSRSRPSRSRDTSEDEGTESRFRSRGGRSRGASEPDEEAPSASTRSRSGTSSRAASARSADEAASTRSARSGRSSRTTNARDDESTARSRSRSRGGSDDDSPARSRTRGSSDDSSTRSRSRGGDDSTKASKSKDEDAPVSDRVARLRASRANAKADDGGGRRRRRGDDD